MTNYQKLAEDWLENEAHGVEGNFPAKYVDGFFYGARSFAIYLDIIEEKKPCEHDFSEMPRCSKCGIDYKPKENTTPQPKKIEPLEEVSFEFEDDGETVKDVRGSNPREIIKKVNELIEAINELRT